MSKTLGHDHRSTTFRLDKLFCHYTGWTFADLCSARGRFKRKIARKAKAERKRKLRQEFNENIGFDKVIENDILEQMSWDYGLDFTD